MRINYCIFRSAGFLIWYPEITNRLKDSSGSVDMCKVFSTPRGSNATGDWTECTTEIPDKVYIDNMAIAVGYFVTNTIIYFCHVKFPLRYITIASMSVSCLSAFLLPNITNEWLIVICFVCFVTGSSVGISIFNVVVVEIFPNYLCGMAISLALLTGRIATFIATNGLGILLETHCEVAVYGTGLLLVTAIICLYSLPKKIDL